ncbi:hypothetical protein K227x_52480 [Rubripirellula lacrimiformis]|uniref:Uncharacterized protein n=1 Tax=Rubripirellula lacrimiformis TaxID=1930273 RepID=A0A517NI60_9BACT|nr:hypothetical protein [Rubripirellula lacrimiformis]QDT06827.1 hypothetical protein K227x_52480 [Rubripirellula lacrimiformis]
MRGMLVLACHLALAFYTDLLPDSPDRFFEVALFAIPFAQCSLVILWVADSSLPSWIRSLLAPVGVFACVLAILDFRGWANESSFSAAMVIGHAVQSVLLAMMIAAGNVFGGRNRQSFDLRTLLGITMASALSFGLLRFVIHHWTLTLSMVELEDGTLMMTLAVISAMVGFLVRWAIVAAIRLPILALMVLTLGVMLRCCFQIFMPGSSATLIETIVFVAAQAVVALVTLWAAGGSGASSSSGPNACVAET